MADRRGAQWLDERLGDRDRAVMATLARVRLASGNQLERLHFRAGLTPNSGPVVRRRVLARLVQWEVLTTFERRIGGVRAGSAGMVFALDKDGYRLMDPAGQRRTPPLPSERFWRHLLDVTELYVRLAELARAGEFTLTAFTTEPASWWRDSYGIWLKPDAYAAVASYGYEDTWWIEVDRATESLPTLRKKLKTYVDFVNDGQLGPGGVIPRVLVTVPTLERRQAVERIVSRLPEPAANFISVAEFQQAAITLAQHLRQ